MNEIYTTVNYDSSGYIYLNLWDGNRRLNAKNPDDKINAEIASELIEKNINKQNDTITTM